ncbi:hypothetical protein ACFL4M_03280 [Pseudomonadota bacterium]
MGITDKIKSLIHGSSYSQDSEMALKDAVEIIQTYAKCLEERAVSASIVTDLNELPCSKEEIKSALIVAMNEKHIDPIQRRYLATGYLQLADYQSGVGDRLIGIDVSTIDIDKENVDALANQVAQSRQEFDSWKPIVEEEQKQLLDELKDAGFEGSL